jgi:uncharacterized protein CbrC (UPF0167 family)
MKHRLAAMAVFLIASGSAAGVEFKDKMALHPPEARAAALAEVMEERLSLTPEQTSAVREVAEKHAGDTDEALGRLPRKQWRKRLEEIRQARDADFRDILSAEQFDAYLEDRREIMKAMRAKMKGS